MWPTAYTMVSTVRPNASATPAKPMPKSGNAAASTALPRSAPAGGDRADPLRDNVGQRALRREAPACEQAHRYRRIEVAARYVADRIHHGQHRQAERERDAREADAQVGERGGEYRAA